MSSPLATPELSRPRAGRRSLWTWLLIGLAIRFVLLPIAIHADTLAVYYRIGLMERGHLDFFEFHLQALPMAIHALWVKATGVGVPGFAGIAWDDVTVERVRNVVVAEFSEPVSVWRVAVWKLPYLVFDIACAFALRSLGGAKLFKLWMLHPVALFIIFLMGKYETMMLLPLLGGLIAWKRGKLEAGFLLLGVAVAMRIYPAFLVLPLALVSSVSWRRRWEFLSLSVLPLVLVLLACTLGSYLAAVVLVVLARLAWVGYRAWAGTAKERYLIAVVLATVLGFLPFTLEMLANPAFSAGPILGHAIQLTHGQLQLEGDDLLYFFFAAFGAVCLWAHRIAVAAASQAGPSVSFRDQLDVALLAALAFSALNTINPQYFIVVVVLGLLRLGTSRDVAGAYALQTVGLFLYMAFFHDGAVTNWLFAPVSPGVVADLPGPTAGLPSAFDSIGPIGLGHSLFLVGAIWMAFEVLRSRRSPERAPVVTRSLVGSFCFWPVALVVVLWLPFRGGVEVREDFVGLAERVVPSLSSGRPLDGLELATDVTRYDPAGSTISAIELRPGMRKGPKPKPAGHSYKVRLIDEAAGWQREQDGVLRISPSAFQPGSDGIIRVPLAAAKLAAEHDYRLAWDSFEPGPGVQLQGRVVRHYPATTIARAVADDLVERYFRATSCGRFFLALGVLAAAGAALLAVGRRRGDDEDEGPADGHPARASEAHEAGPT
ncbi:MAG: hypothetical protein P1V81_17360 [Planctomycetota bacterium]|nr:hypothetical protein [Planctomycetota bacterium]